MIKYIITSGTSVVNELIEQPEYSGVRLTTKCTPIKYDKIGEAMIAAIKVNRILGSDKFRVVSMEISESVPVSSNL